MFISGPNTRVSLRSWGFINKPSVSPPGLLKVVFLLCILSTIGTLLYGVFTTISIQSDMYDTPLLQMAVASLHFLLPIVIAYTIVVNSPLSRPLILVYTVSISAVFLNQWQLSGLELTLSTSRLAIVIIGAGTVIFWLYRSKKMRYYYALVSDRVVPEDLLPYGESLIGDSWLNEKLRSRINWLANHLESIVLIGFIIATLIALSITA